ncbi:MAG: molybdate ABC transporter substrate-binding protein [Rhizobiales bacterium]|nr:molybdate ABC transporter substrate-binding protein [Hyphomicrobiales bacterium]NRB15918.1 molybdate ABC transporter substrate-binding protein [Hyphomicrobiales bacterium]
MTAIFTIFSAMLWLCHSVYVLAETSLIATAANFLPTMQQLVDDFEAQTPHKINLSVASSGKLYGQITNGAPFDAFFSADQNMPKRLIAENLAMRASRFTYASGRLVIYTNLAELMPLSPDILSFTKLKVGQIAIANPQLAPYGIAAIEALKNLNLAADFEGRLIYAENVAQAYQFAATGNAHYAIVSLSQMAGLEPQNYLPLLAELHKPILQDAVLLNHGKNNAATLEFLAYIKGQKAKDIITGFGYK